jgi:hypothetical protein
MIRAGTIYKATDTPLPYPLKAGVKSIFSEGVSLERDTRCLFGETESVSPEFSGEVHCSRRWVPAEILFEQRTGRVARESLYCVPTMRYTKPNRRISGAWLSCLVSLACSVLISGLQACAPRGALDMSAAEKKAIADSLKRLVVNAYDLSKPDPVKNLMSLYPAEGRVISASGGVMTTTRPQLQQGIKAFWTYVGQNMRSPRWEWTSMNVDVLAPDAAVMTSTYRIPHLTPAGMNHVIAGAWTAVFQKRGVRWVVIQEHLSDVQSNPNAQMSEMNMNPQKSP